MEGSFGAGKPNEPWKSSEVISFHVLSPLQDKNSEAGSCLYSSGLDEAADAANKGGTAIYSPFADIVSRGFFYAVLQKGERT